MHKEAGQEVVQEGMGERREPFTKVPVAMAMRTADKR